MADCCRNNWDDPNAIEYGKGPKTKSCCGCSCNSESEEAEDNVTVERKRLTRSDFVSDS